MNKFPTSTRKIPLSAADKAKRYRAKRMLDKDRHALYNANRRLRNAVARRGYDIDVSVMAWAVTYLSSYAIEPQRKKIGRR